MNRAATNRRNRVLVADGDPETFETMVSELDPEDYAVEHAPDGVVAWQTMRRGRVDLAVVDINVARLDGLSLLHRLRSAGDHTPVLLLSDRGLDVVLALEIGGDDCITKPFVPRELAARARNVLRRAHASAAPPIIGFAEMTIDLRARAVTRDGQPVHLTALEFDLLVCLSRTPGHVVERSELLRQVWGSDRAGQHTLTEHIRRLRGKLGRSLIRTAPGYGYRLDVTRHK